MFFILTTTLGNDPILTNILQMGWNHQPEKLLKNGALEVQVTDHTLLNGWYVDLSDDPWIQGFPRMLPMGLQLGLLKMISHGINPWYICLHLGLIFMVWIYYVITE